MTVEKPISLRIDARTLAELDEQAQELRRSRSELVRRYVEEGVRMDRHPGILFRPGPAGRRAALVAGPDVWTVIAVMRDLAAPPDQAVQAAAEYLELPAGHVQSAVRYYAEHRDEINDFIRRNEEEAERARKAWLREQAALA
ncbi:MAG: ribbon-helix-helix protein, CopG family [Gaiellaceae bacterium]